MKIKFRQWFGSLRTTTKISLSIGLLMAIIVMEMVIGYAALSAVWRADNAIQTSTEMQRLAMTMGRNWETARRLQREFFMQVATIGAEEAYRVQALASAAKISEVIRDGATLRRLLLAPDASMLMRERVPDLDLILATVTEYATLFDASSKLELRLTAGSSGLQAQRAAVVATLADALASAADNATLFPLFFTLRTVAEQPQTTGVSAASAQRSAADAALRDAIAVSLLPVAQKNLLVSTLDEYARMSDEILQTEAQIHDQLAVLKVLGERIEPNLLTLMATANKESGQARLQIAETRQLAIMLMAGATLAGFLAAVAIAVLLHYSVTRKITLLTRVAGQLQAGDLNARAVIDTTDELGRLAATLNAMAGELGLTIERLEVVRTAVLELTSELDVDKVLARALDVSASLTGAEAGCIALVDGNQLVRAQRSGPVLPVTSGAHLPTASGILARVLETQRTEIWLDAAASGDGSQLFPADHAQVALPLISAQQLVGVLALAARRSASFANDTLRFLELYAAGVAVAIHNALMYGDAQHLAVVDTLTGLYNRRGLFEISQRAIGRALRHQQPLSAIFLDIDHFKQFNDRYSYAVGDLVLCTLAATVQANVREGDLVSRYGGEEFFILLPEIGQAEAVEIAGRLCKAVAAEQVQTLHGALTVTISLGVATRMLPPGVTPGDGNCEAQILTGLIEEAGRMLHEAKANGRNRVVAASGTAWESAPIG